MQSNTSNAAVALDFKNKHIGIWGYGITGAAAVDYFESQRVRQITICDAKPLSPTIHTALVQKNIIVRDASELELFLEEVDYIVKSPGISCNNLSAHYIAKIIPEFNIFAASWRGPIVAITGTVGKTTVTSLLHQLLCGLQKSSVAGGNIGTSMLRLLTECTLSEYAIIELSSFQTELGIAVAPDLAIITNIYPNHLDRHGSFENYRTAKLELIRFQNNHQKALLPLSCASVIQRSQEDHNYAWFSLHKPSSSEREHCASHDTWYYIEDNYIVREQYQQTTVIGPRQPTTITFVENIVILTAAIDLLGLTLEPATWNNVTIPAHRLAPVATHRSITFFNDSKSTVPAATLAAIQQIAPHKPVLFIGGISKGVDRKPFIQQLRGNITLAVCFGNESEQLAAWCTEYHIPAYAESTLETAYKRYIQQHAQVGDYVLFSPAGASYDLFKNYVERGEQFVELVQATVRHDNITLSELT